MLATILLTLLPLNPDGGATGALCVPQEEGASAGFAELEKAYDKAALDWRRAERAARRAGETFDQVHPIHEYLPRFQALADAGSAEATLWVGVNVDDMGLSMEETAKRKRAAFSRLVAGHAADPDLMKSFLLKAGRQSKWLEPRELVGLLEPVFEKNPDDSLREKAAYEIARNHERMESDEALEKAEAWYRRIIAEFPESKTAEKARTRLEGFQIAVGRIAPDFEAEDVDGASFKLSDYRGKVVVMDFWGFW